MRKFFALMVLVLLGLGGCLPIEEGRASEDDLNDCGLPAVLTFSNGFGVGFLVRNETGGRLYYNDDFRVDSEPMTSRHNRAGVQFINHGDTKEMHASWETLSPTGIYTFERDFFLDGNLTELYKTLVLTFDVVGAYHFSQDALPIPAEIQALRDSRVNEVLAFQIAGGPSEIIVLAGEVTVSRTGVAFSMANLSERSFMHGLHFSLLVYDNGWKHAPTIIDRWVFSDIGFMVWGGEIIEDSFSFERLFGPLPNGAT